MFTKNEKILGELVFMERNALKMETPLDYGKWACDTTMKIPADQLPPVGGFHYHQGVCLMGMQKIYQLCENEEYYRYIKSWVDSVLNEDGTPKRYKKEQFDDLMAGMLLFLLDERENDPKYRKCLDLLVSEINEWDRNEYGGFSHKRDVTPNQVWLDGLFMYGPLIVNYAKRYGKNPEFYDIVVEQLELMWEHMRDEKTGLLRHAWDPSLSGKWKDCAEPETGLAPEAWGRAMGWYCVTLMEIYKDMPEKYRAGIAEKEKQLIDSLISYQSKNGLWYQVIDKGNEPGNWEELSCSSLFVCAMCQAIEYGILDDSYLKYAQAGYEGIVSMLETNDDGDLLIGHVCIGTGVGTYQFYIERPTCINDLHGIGTFLYMIASAEKTLKNN